MSVSKDYIFVSTRLVIPSVTINSPPAEVLLYQSSGSNTITKSYTRYMYI